MSRFIRRGGESVTALDLSQYTGVISGDGSLICNLRTEWEYIYHCPCITSCLASQVFFDIPFEEYNAIKIQHNLYECTYNTTATTKLNIPGVCCTYFHMTPTCNAVTVSPSGTAGQYICPGLCSGTATSTPTYTEWTLRSGCYYTMRFELTRNMVASGAQCYFYTQQGQGIMNTGNIGYPFLCLSCLGLYNECGIGWCSTTFPSYFAILGQRKSVGTIGD